MAKLTISPSKPKKKSPLRSPPIEIIKKVKSPKNKPIKHTNELEKSIDSRKKPKLSDSESLKTKKPKIVGTIEQDKSTDIGKKRQLSDSEAPKTKKLKIVSEDVSRNVKATDLKVHEQSQPKTMEEAILIYPVLNDEELVQKYQAVPITNNQKGRIRQRLRDFFKSSSSEKDPEAINMRLSAILKQEHLSDSDHRQIRILHNMLRTAVKEMIDNNSSPKSPEKKKKKKNKKTEKINNGEGDGDGKAETEVKVSETKEKQVSKVKGPKRYVVFVGNLPYDVDKDSILRHFSQIVSKIKDVRIPKKTDSKKGGIAYLELADEPSYQMALSRHHSMLENRRINVLYTTTGKSKIDKTEAKGKTAKLIALQKSGKLLGSTPLKNKRSARRKKMREAQAKQQSQ